MSIKAESFERETLIKFEEKYLPYFKELLAVNRGTISVSELAETFRSEERQLRREMAGLTGSGQLRSEYEVCGLITEIEYYLGYYNCVDVALAGLGRAGRELIKNKSFVQNGFKISYVFDPEIKEEKRLENIAVKPLSGLRDLAGRVHVHMGIIAVNPEKAQKTADLMISSGILAIWNVSGAHVETPHEFIISEETFGEHEDIENNEAVVLSLTALNQQLKSKMGWDKY
jgi:redox-sensing transcriptional repressor